SVEHWQVLLKAMVLDATQTLTRLPLLTEAQRKQVLHDWNPSAVDYPREALVHQLVERHAAQSPDAIALVHEDQHLSYAQLNRRANQLAHALIAQGVLPDARVAVCLPRGMEMVIALLAVLKAGGAYVPIDPDYPLERIDYLLDDSQPQLLITRTALPSALPVLDLDAAEDGAPWPDVNPDPRFLGLDAQHLAYVIYTSGSTGKPKGVMIEHRHVCHQVFALQSTYHLSARDRVLQFAPFTFDMSVEEIFGALCSGAALVLRTPAWISDASTFWHLCQRNAITVANLPVVFWNTLLREKQACIPDCIRQIMIGGEAVSQAAIEVWYARDGWLPALFNAYGPTEATVNATVHLIERVNTPGCIGRPLPNTRVYVLDHAAQPVPVGVIGELYIGGAGVARGYLNRAQLTATCFVDDPFAEQPAARMYKTGDRVRWHADGSLEYLGRNDNQVKIRGFRIELGEIEARLRSHAAVTDAVVSAWQEAAQETRLVAYYLAAEAQDASQLRAWVAQQLPDYMLPAAWVHLTAWPLNSNGKLDRRALPAPGAAAFASQGYVAPQGEPETTLAMLWADVLGVERVGRHDNFFTLGGHSLLAVQLVSRIRQMMGRAVSLSALFAQPLLADFATVVEQAPLGSLPPITPVNRAAPLALSFSQQRLWFLSQLQASASAAYHIAGGVKINGQLNRPALQAALDRIVARHEALRTGFTSLNGTPFQHIHEPAAFALAVHDLRHQPDVEGALQHLSALEAAAPFDLEQGPLIRGQLVQVGECEHVLLITLHHIASDGWSLVRFLRELGALYDAFCTGQSDPLPPLPLQYVDYAAWQRRWIDGAVLQGQLTYWREQLSDAPPLLTLPADRPRPAVQEYTGGRVDFSLDTALTAELKALAARHDVTLYMTLLAAWAALLARLSGQEDIVIGSPVAGRTRTELEPLIGFFVNTLALRCRVNGSETLAALLAQVKATTLAALAHQDLPFEQLVEALNPQRSLAHSPLFQTLFAWQEAGGDGLTLPGLQTQPLNVGQVTAKFDLLLALEDDGEQLQGSIEYASSLFDQSTVERYAEHLQILLGAMVRDASQPLASLPVLSDAQRRHVLYDWNTTAADYPRAQAIHHLFEAQVARTPQAVALLDDDQQLSYDALNQHANVLAHTLLSSGVGPGERVAVCLPRGVQSIVAILAVLKAGGAYLPIDPAYPDERLRYMLQDGQPRVVLTDAALAARVPSSSAGVRLILTDSLPPLPASPPASNPATAFTAQQLAYVIYTSGSTGQPKGVCMPHRALVNLMHWQQRTQTTPGGLRTLQYAALGFDVSFQEIFSTLLSGGELVLISEAERLDMAMLGELLRRRRIQRLYLPYVALKALADQVRADRQPIDDLQQIITAGEQVVITETIRQVFADQLAHVRLHNHYGPTETHVVSAFELPACAHHWPRLPSIGRPVANARVYVLDALQQPVPVGVGGELYLAGDAVACGYFNQPDLTLERFLPDPFSAASDQPAPMMYRSGDLGCWQADGTLAYLGRADRQVKVRGFRVELEEIEAQLNTVAGISQAVVLLREDDPQSQRLVAYLLVDEAMRDACDPQTLRSYLSNRLPEYMVPAAYVPLSHFPISPNGKLDRDALPMPDAGAYASQAYEPPQGEIEPLLAALWCSLLNVEQVGRQDHFFALGGHSLLAVQLISRIKNQLMVEIRLQDVFAAPQLHRMADLLVQRIDLQLKELMSQDDSLDRR
uniref:non-ribosomal peptide synthetase n=1 Tax=Pseudomonas syringae pv. coryli TaxID=317659 RepID=UPI000AC1C4AF